MGKLKGLEVVTLAFFPSCRSCITAHPFVELTHQGTADNFPPSILANFPCGGVVRGLFGAFWFDSRDVLPQEVFPKTAAEPLRLRSTAVGVIPCRLDQSGHMFHRRGWARGRAAASAAASSQDTGEDYDLGSRLPDDHGADAALTLTLTLVPALIPICGH